MFIRLFDHQKFIECLISVKCLILKENKVGAFEIIYSLVPLEWLERWEGDADRQQTTTGRCGECVTVLGTEGTERNDTWPRWVVESGSGRGRTGGRR